MLFYLAFYFIQFNTNKPVLTNVFSVMFDCTARTAAAVIAVNLAFILVYDQCVTLTFVLVVIAGDSDIASTLT